jgi:pyrimidine operon attenuation protein/uracil phosphoribosyltransferase
VSEVLLDPNAITAAIERVAAAIVERSKALGQQPILVAIRRGGDPFVGRIAAHIETATGTKPPIGAVDITLYRDDAATQLPNPRIGPSHLPTSVEKRWVILVDDVILTGRTIRAALDAVLDFGRPSRIELAVLIDRGGRELPIQPDYAGSKTNIGADKRVEVILKRVGPAPGDEEPWAILVPPNPSPSTPGSVPPTR